MSAVDDLNDNCFSLATHMIAELSEAFEDEIERKPTIDELCEIITWGIRSCAVDILEDINVQNLIALKPQITKRRKIVLKPGDVIAIPALSGECFLTVYIGKFRYHGDSMGLLSGRHACRKIAADMIPTPIARPMFFHLLGVTSGRWAIVGHRPDWLALFPNPPEYFYAKHYYLNDENIGPYGSAETSIDFDTPLSNNDTRRDLSEAEAREIGLLDKNFVQSGLMEEVEGYLERLIGASTLLKEDPE